MLSPPIIACLGWPWVFWAFGALGFVWLAFWEPVAAAASAAADAAAAIGGGGVGGGGKAGAMAAGLASGGDKAGGRSPGSLASFAALPWARFVRNRVFLTVLLQHCTFGVGYNLCMSWLPAFFKMSFHVNVRESSSLSILPFLAMALTTNAAGWAADHLINRQLLSRCKTRKLMQAVRVWACLHALVHALVAWATACTHLEGGARWPL